MTMHIALCGTELCSVLDQRGGLERCIQLWAGELSKYCRVSLIDLCPQDAPAAESYPEAQIGYVRCDNAFHLPAILSSIGADVAHLHNRPLIRTALPTLVTFHNYPYAWFGEAPIDRSALKESMQGRYMTAVSNALLTKASEMIGTDNVKSFLLYPPLSHEFFQKDHLGGGGVLFASRLMKKKGVLEAIEAISLAGASPRSVFLDTITPFLKNTQEYLEMKKVILESGIALKPAALGSKEMADYYALADVVLQIATEEEGLGLIPLEAQAVGANVVATGPGGLRETVFWPNHYLGKASPRAIAASLEYFLSNPSPERPKELSVYRQEESARRLFQIFCDLYSRSTPGNH